MAEDKPKIDVGPFEHGTTNLDHFDNANYGLDEDTHSEFRASVRQALTELKELIDACEEIWSPVGQGVQYVRGMAIVVQELNKVSSNAVGRILVYTGQPHFVDDVKDGD